VQRKKRRSQAISRILFLHEAIRAREHAHAISPDLETTIPLVPTSLAGSSDLPGSFGRAVLSARLILVRPRFPIWSCSVRGFACHLLYSRRGALLPHLFTLTLNRRVQKDPPYVRRPGLFRPGVSGGIFSVPLSFRSP
jgi:hypothetical protein